jgi:hypothetical protein
MRDDKPPDSDLDGPRSRLEGMQISPSLRRALARCGTEMQTVVDLHRVGAFEFSRMDGVGVVVFQQAADLLRGRGLSWPPDARLDKTRARILSKRRTV